MSTKRLVAAWLLVVLVAAACGEGAGQIESSDGPAVEAASTDWHDARWEPLPEAPLSARHGAVAAWTGREVVIVGGRDTDPCPPGAGCVAPDRPALRDGARYDPASRTWTRMAEAPVPILVYGEVAVVDGSVYMLTDGEFLAYAVAADTWQELPSPPGRLPQGARLVAVDGRVVAYHSSQEHGYDPDAVFDPATGEWSTLPRDPLALSYDRTMVWTGDQLVLLGKEVVPDPGSERPSLVRAARRRGVDGEWERLPDSEIIGWDFRWAGGKIVSADLGSADGGDTNGWGRSYSYGGMLDPATDTWQALPDPPSPEDAVASGGDVYESVMPIAGRDIVAVHGYVLHVRSGDWIPLPRPTGGPGGGGARVVAGDRIVTWGGYTWGNDGATLLDDGWEWTSTIATRDDAA